MLVGFINPNTRCCLGEVLCTYEHGEYTPTTDYVELINSSTKH